MNTAYGSGRSNVMGRTCELTAAQNWSQLEHWTNKRNDMEGIII